MVFFGHQVVASLDACWLWSSSDATGLPCRRLVPEFKANLPVLSRMVRNIFISFFQSVSLYLGTCHAFRVVYSFEVRGPFGVFSKTFFLQINTSLFIRSARLVSLLFRPSLLRSSLIPLRTPSPLSLPIPIGWRGVNAPAGITKRRQFVHNCEAHSLLPLFFGATVDDGAGNVRLSAAGCFFGT